MANKFKVKNPYASGTHDVSSKHGTNINYQKSGSEGPPFLKGLVKGIKKVGGNFLKGKGAFGALNPLGAIASRSGLFGNKNKGNTADPVLEANSSTGVQPTHPDDVGAGGVVDNTVAPDTTGVDPNAVDPEAASMATYKKPGAPNLYKGGGSYKKPGSKKKKKVI